MNHPIKICAAAITACLALPQGPLAQAAALKPITHEALWMMKRVGAPVVSPDGKWVIYPVLEPAYETDKAVSDLWLVPVDGLKPPRRITNTKAPESDVAWSADSTSIAFATKRENDDVEQIYILNLAEGGEAHRLTNISTGAGSPQWRPDGKAILFESRVYPNALDDEANKKIAAEHKERKYNVRVYEHFPVRYWNQWLDERQPTIMVQSIEQGAAAKDILSGSALARTAGFYGTDTETSVTLAARWSPDGREVVFTATTERWHAAFAHVHYHLYRSAAQGSEPVIISPAPGDYQEAMFSPGGKALFFKYAPQDSEVYHLAQLYKVAWPAGGQPTLVTRDFDRETAHYALTPDGRLVYLLVPEAGKENLYRVPTEGGTPVLVVAPPTGGYTALEIGRKAAKPELIATYGSSVSPEEVVRLDVAHRSHVNLTQIDTAAAAAIDW